MLVKAKTSKGETIQIYDSEYLKDLDLKDFGLTDIEDITELDGLLPIYPLNDIILNPLILRNLRILVSILGEIYLLNIQKLMRKFLIFLIHKENS